MKREILSITSVLKGVLKPCLLNYYHQYILDHDEKCSYCEDFDDENYMRHECTNKRTKHCSICKPMRTTCCSCYKRICLFHTGYGMESVHCPKCGVSLMICNPTRLSQERIKEIEIEAKEIAKLFKERINDT